MTRRTTATHLDEIAGLLARGYVRLRQKRAGMHTSRQHSPGRRDISLDGIRQAERSLAGDHSLEEEEMHDDLIR